MLAHLVGPEAIENGEIYSAANDREQAAQVFKVAAQIVQADPELVAMVRVVDSTKHIACYANGSFYKAVSAEAGTKHGLNPSLVTANPALGDFRSLADMRPLAAKAQRMPAEEPKFRNLYLNQRVAPHSSLISRAEWTACAGDARIEDGAEVNLALDLASTDDLAALAIGAAGDTTRVQAHFWKPADWLEDYSRRDFGGVHRRYVEWAAAGHLETTPGRPIDPSAIAIRIAELCGRYRVLGLAYDRWRIETLRRELDRIGLATFLEGENGDGLRLVPWEKKSRSLTVKAIQEAGEHEEFEPDGRRREYFDGMRELQRALALRPWLASPLDVREGEPAPNFPTLYAESWSEALEMRRELEAAIGIRPRN